jgi:hypothetical protein
MKHRIRVCVYVSMCICIVIVDEADPHTCMPVCVNSCTRLNESVRVRFCVRRCELMVLSVNKAIEVP